MDAVEGECWASTVVSVHGLLDGSTPAGPKCVQPPGENGLGLCDKHFQERFSDLIGSE